MEFTCYRSDGSLERQYRLKSEKGSLPICYKLDETDNSRFIYVLPNSATTYDVKAGGEVRKKLMVSRHGLQAYN